MAFLRSRTGRPMGPSVPLRRPVGRRSPVRSLPPMGPGFSSQPGHPRRSLASTRGTNRDARGSRRLEPTVTPFPPARWCSPTRLKTAKWLSLCDVHLPDLLLEEFPVRSSIKISREFHRVSAEIRLMTLPVGVLSFSKHNKVCRVRKYRVRTLRTVFVSLGGFVASQFTFPK